MQTLAIPNMPEDLMDIMARRAAANGRVIEEEALAWRAAPPPTVARSKTRRSHGCKARGAGARFPAFSQSRESGRRWKPRRCSPKSTAFAGA